MASVVVGFGRGSRANLGFALFWRDVDVRFGLRLHPGRAAFEAGVERAVRSGTITTNGVNYG